MADNIRENNLTAFKKYLEDPDSEIQQYLGENGVVYTYDVNFKVYSYDSDGRLIPTDADTENVSSSTLSAAQTQAAGGPMANMNRMRSMMNGSGGGAENFSELMPGKNGAAVSSILTDSYEMLYGTWPDRYDEVVLVLDENNSVPAAALYQLGLITGGEYTEITEQIRDGKAAAERIWSYEEICEHTFYLLPACDHYEEQEDGTFVCAGEDVLGAEPLLERGIELTVTGVIRPAKDAANAIVSTPMAYTSLLTDFIIQHTNESAVVLAQEKDTTVNVLNGMAFEAADDTVKSKAAKEYLSGLGISDKASFYTMVMYYNAQNASSDGKSQTPETGSPAAAAPGAGQMDEAAMAAALDAWLAGTPDTALLLSVYDEYIDGASYEENMKSFGKVSYDAPSSISIYTDSFESKDAVSGCIEHYNARAEEKNRITYTDYVALLTGSLTTIVDVISYVLIAFVAVSLVVSGIMIGIITHISVLERTKEIGILRAMGASKHNISQVFNAETIIIGLLAGMIGVGVTLLLTVPLNALLQELLNAAGLSAALPAPAAFLLIILSMAITVIAGLIPARAAAKKDPVAALRSE